VVVALEPEAQYVVGASLTWLGCVGPGDKDVSSKFSRSSRHYEFIENVDIDELGEQYRPDVLLTSRNAHPILFARGSKPGS